VNLTLEEQGPVSVAMNFKKILKSGAFSLHLEGNTKEDIIEEMIDMLVDSGAVKDRSATLEAVLERERKMSTGMQFGVAIPHGKTSTIDDLAVAFALKKEGVDFGSLDGQPSNIFIMTVSSTNRTGPHIQYLSEISKLLNSPLIRQRLLNAASVEEIMEILTS
jgi:PTS system nitrogen regulatory IIA component